jgi:hypothetical protein
MGDSFDLDRSGTAGKPVGVTLPATDLPAVDTPAPSEDARETGLRLIAPEPPQPFTGDQAVASIKLERETITKLDVMCAEFVVAIVKLDPADAAFSARVADVRGMGADEVQAARQLIARILDHDKGTAYYNPG